MDTTPHAEISAFLDRYADALAAGDLPGVAACYAVPALVVGDAATIPVAEAAQVEAAVAGAPAAPALPAGPLPGVPACYAVPALVVGDAATIPVAEAAQVEAAFAGAAD